MLRQLSVRWKIILPFALVATVTWVVAASVLQNSASRSSRQQSQAEADRIAAATGNHIALRAQLLGD